MSEQQKWIYNLYLKAYRTNNGNPFRPKKDFTGFEDKPEYAEILKLTAFFNKYPHLLTIDFFNAPYKLYNDEKKYYSLKFFASPRGLKTCMNYFKTLIDSNPDEQIESIKDSLKFIAGFCIEKKIKMGEYYRYKSVIQPDFLIHLKEYKLNWYIVFGIKNMFDEIYAMPLDEFELYFGSHLNINELYNKFNNSKRAKIVVKEGVRKIEDFIAKKLNG